MPKTGVGVVKDVSGETGVAVHANGTLKLVENRLYG